MCATHLIMLYLSVKSLCSIFLSSVIKFASVVYEEHNFRHNLTFDLIVTLTLGIGT